jgi:hypothetical protein
MNSNRPPLFIDGWMMKFKKKYFFEFFVVQTITKWLVQRIANVVYV